MELVGEKVYLRYLETKDAEALLQLESRNQSFFKCIRVPENRNFILWKVNYNESRGTWRRKI
jgi:hypothetical protein